MYLFTSESVSAGHRGEKIAAHFPLTPLWITERFGLDKQEKEGFSM